jgi:acetoacetate decarboxylase
MSDLPFDRAADHKRICDELHKLYLRKNHDYGNSFSKTFAQFGLVSVAIRLTDKTSRLCTLANAKSTDMQVPEESVKDTLRDLANYAIMAVVELDSKSDFPHT